MNTRLIEISIAAIIGVILISGMVAPVISDYVGERTYEYTNTGVNVVRASDVDLTDTVTFQVTYDDESGGNQSGMYTSVNGSTPVRANQYACFVASDAFNLRSYGDTAGFFYMGGAVGNIYPLADDNNIVIKGTIENGYVTLTYHGYGGTTVNLDPLPISWFTYQNPDGDMVIGLAESNGKILYYKTADNVRGANWINTTSEWYSFKGTNVKVGSEEITANLETESLPGDAYSFSYTNSSETSDYTFVVDNSGEDYTVAPYVYVTAYSFETVADSEIPAISLLLVIPLLLVLAIIIGISAQIFRKRY